MLYNIERRFYRTTKDIETGNAYRVYRHTFDNMTLEECQIVLRKLVKDKRWIDVIVPIV